MTDGSTFYEAVGGRDTFVRLVDRFYDGVATDPVMRGMYPAELGPARERMTAFLAQYWGGPRDYSEARGHPRLRTRHAPFRMDADTPRPLAATHADPQPDRSWGSVVTTGKIGGLAVGRALIGLV